MTPAARLLCVTLTFVAPPLAYAAPAGEEGPVYVFKSPSVGTKPVGGLVRDPQGNLFGTTMFGGDGAYGDQLGYGTIYEISPASPGAPSGTYTSLHHFGTGRRPDGMQPSSTLVRAPDGTLYGTTLGGGSAPNYNGTVFALAPPKPGRKGWTLTTIHDFGGFAQGYYPVGTLYRTASGTLYGAAADGIIAGIVYSLTRPAAGSAHWTYRILYRFQNGADGGHPSAGVIGDGTRALYGTTATGGANGTGTIFRLTPPGTGRTDWNETTLYDFSYEPDDSVTTTSDLVTDAAGNLYGTVTGRFIDEAYELSPPPTGQLQWIYTTINSFMRYRGQNPTGPLLPDAQGGFYGTTSGGGTGNGGVVYHLAPPAAGQSAWTETVLHDFPYYMPNYDATTSDGSEPASGVILTDRGWLVGTTPYGVGGDGFGMVFKVHP